MSDSLDNINKLLVGHFEEFNTLLKADILPLIQSTKTAIDTQDETLIKDTFYDINVIINDDNVLKNLFEVNTLLHKEIDTSSDLNFIEHELTKKILNKYQKQFTKSEDKYTDLYFEILGVYNSLSNYRYNKNFLPDIVKDILKLKIKYNAENIKQYIQINDLNLLYSKVSSNMSEENAAKVQLKLDIEMERLKDVEIKKKLDSYDAKSNALNEANVEEKFKNLLNNLDEILQIDL